MKKIDKSLYTNNENFDNLDISEKIKYLEEILRKTVNTGILKKNDLNWKGDNYTYPSILCTNFIYKVLMENKILGKNDFICSFRLMEFPGCCGIALFYNFIINQRYRNLGIGELIVTLIELYSQYQGYTVIVCTDVVTNNPMKKILENQSWKSAFNFINIKTENNVELSYKNLLL